MVTSVVLSSGLGFCLVPEDTFSFFLCLSDRQAPENAIPVGIVAAQFASWVGRRDVHTDSHPKRALGAFG